MHSLETQKFLKKTCPPNEKEKDPQSRLEKRGEKKKTPKKQKNPRGLSKWDLSYLQPYKGIWNEEWYKGKEKNIKTKKMHTPRAWTWIKTRLQGHTKRPLLEKWTGQTRKRGTLLFLFSNREYATCPKTKFKESREWALTNRKRTHPAAFSRLLWPLWTYPDSPCQRLSASRRPHRVVRGLPRGSNREGSIVIPRLRHRLCRLGAGGSLY